MMSYFFLRHFETSLTTLALSSDEPENSVVSYFKFEIQQNLTCDDVGRKCDLVHGDGPDLEVMHVHDAIDLEQLVADVVVVEAAGDGLH